MPSEHIRQYPFMAWERLKPAISWKQGQHVLAVGGTGSGKSTVAGQFLSRRSLVVVCVSKGMDEIFSHPPYSEYRRVSSWPPPRGSEKVLLWPSNAGSIVETRAVKQRVFRKMFDDVLLKVGHWCIDVDEEHYMVESLQLGREITDILEQGRSAHISMWNNTQRPAGIPLATYVNSSHAFFFQTQEDYDVKRLSSMRNKWTSGAELAANIERLDAGAHEFVYLDKTGRLPPVRSIVKLTKGEPNGARKR